MSDAIHGGADHSLGLANSVAASVPVVRSAADAWAALVMKLVTAPFDPTTLPAWASLACVSVGALRQRCYAANVSPKQSLRFGRLLRAVLRAEGQRWEPAMWLVAADARTLQRLVREGGLAMAARRAPSAEQHLAGQTIMEAGTAAMCALRERLTACRGMELPPASGGSAGN